MLEDKRPKVGKIVVDRTSCISAATCEAMAPGTFELDNDRIAVVKPENGWDDAEAIIEAAKACPVLAVKVYDTEGNLIFPEEE